MNSSARSTADAEKSFTVSLTQRLKQLEWVKDAWRGYQNGHLHVCKHAHNQAWLNGWMAGWMDGRRDGGMDRLCTHESMQVWTYVRMYVFGERYVFVCEYACMDGIMIGCMYLCSICVDV